MIPIGSYKYLPSARMGVTPFGPEYYVENFLIKDNKPIYFYLKAGKFAEMTYTRMGIECPHLWDVASIALGFRVDTWHQPKIDARDPRFSVNNVVLNQGVTPFIKGSELGIFCSVIAEKKIWTTGAIFLQLGAKTKGFVVGEDLPSSPIFRVGITLW